MTRRLRPSGQRLVVVVSSALIAQAWPQNTSASVARAESPPVPESLVASAITEAASRFGLPERWIRAVIQAESAFDRTATSPVGAMGLMQVMPATYRELRIRYGLGGDPYHPRDNIIAGAAYLRELYDRFGASGFLAAYNAGPARYQEHLRTGRRLPAETRIYVARITARLRGDAQDGPQRTSVRLAPARAPDPASAAIFVVLGGNRSVTSPAAASAHSELFPNAGLGPSGHE